MPWCCGIAVAIPQMHLEHPQQEHGLTMADRVLQLLTLGMRQPVLNQSVMKHPNDEPTMLNRRVVN